jgi:hypothetical protein
MTTPKTTAVDWLLTELARRVATINSEPNGLVRETMIDSLLIGTEQAREIEREHLTNLVQSLMDYTTESHSILGHDEREASEFVDVYLNGGQHGE